MNGNIYLEDLDAKVLWIDWEKQIVSVQKWVLLNCECCSEAVDDEYKFTELSQMDKDKLNRFKGE
jgi:hypothetical protein